MGRDDLFEERDVGGFRHWRVYFAAHRDGDDVFVRLITLNVCTPKILKLPGVRSVVPLLLGKTSAAPLFVSAHHWLNVGGAHHDAVLISQLGVQRIISAECVVPHRGP